MLTNWRTASLRARISARPDDHGRDAADRERQTISIRDFKTGETQSVSLLSFTAEVEPFRRRSAS
jgi:hypothetical protein